MIGPRRFHASLSGVQSTPRIMRGAPVRRGSMVDVPLVMRDKAILQQQGRLGSLSGSTLGDIDFDDGSLHECARAGEVMDANGNCAPDARSPINPYSNPAEVVAAGVKLQTAVSAAAKKSGMPSTQLLVLGAICVGAILYFGRK